MSENNRHSKRQPVSVDGMIYDRCGQQLFTCTIRNVSASGAQLELAGESVIPQDFVLALSRDGRVRRQCKKVWQFSTVVGVRFAEQAAAS